jgi:hypothetical protein
MNDTEMEKWLAERFRAAPNPEPSERLRQAVGADRVRAGARQRWTRPSRSFALSGRRPIFAGMVGLAATVVLAAGLLAAVTNRPTSQPTQTPQAQVQGIRWHAETKVDATALVFGPFLTSAGGRLFAIGQGLTISQGSITATPVNGSDFNPGTVIVWSSADGATWTQVSAPGAFETNGSRFAPAGFSVDGNGGLIAVGNTFVGNDMQPPTAWHSSDGRTWTREQIGSSGPGAVLSVAARPGAVVAFGSQVALVGQAAGSLAAWFSADGGTWSQALLPDSADYTPRSITAWKGGFAAVASGTGTGVSAAWTSTDGRTWVKSATQLTHFDATAMSALGDRVVAVGADLSDGGVMVPASWSSNDGRTWVESTASAREPATGFGDVTLAGNTLVAVGRSFAAYGEGTAPATPPASVWISRDGLTWRLLAADPTLTIPQTLHTHLTGFGGRVLLATQGANAVEAFLGDLAP